MKLSYIAQLLVVLILLLCNDLVYYARQEISEGIELKAAKHYCSIEANPAVLIVEGKKVDNLKDVMSNLYFVKSVGKQNKAELIELLSEQYALTDAGVLLEELTLPSVLEVTFLGNSFERQESEIFDNTIEKEAGLYKVLYDEKTYIKDWESITRSKNWLDLMDKYWSWLYSLLCVITAIFIFNYRLSYENKKHNYWKVFVRSGGSRKKLIRSRLFNSILMVLFPAIVALGGQIYLCRTSFTNQIPDYTFHAIRAIILLFISISSIFFLRRDKDV